MHHIAANALIGAYIADAATLGVHWLYDPDRIAALGQALWREPDGAAFGPGGWWHGYIDKATKGTLANIASGTTPTGANDDQIPALSALPALIAMEAAPDICANAVAQISNRDTTAAYAPAATEALRAILSGASIADALASGVDAALPAARDSLAAALASTDDPVAYAGDVGRACPLPQTLPVAFQIAASARDYTEAVETNARVAGDNCGRAIFLGALFGAGDPPPALWAARLREGPALAAEIDALARTHGPG